MASARAACDSDLINRPCVMMLTFFNENTRIMKDFFFVCVCVCVILQPANNQDASDVHMAIEEIERRFQEVMHRHSPRKNLHIHVIASRVRLEMKGAFTDVKDRIKVCAIKIIVSTPCVVQRLFFFKLWIMTVKQIRWYRTTRVPTSSKRDKINILENGE